MCFGGSRPSSRPCRGTESRPPSISGLSGSRAPTRRASDMHVALREWDLDSMIRELYPDSIENVGPDISDAKLGVLYPDKNVMIYGTVSKALQPDGWLGIGKNSRSRRCCLDHQPLSQSQIAIIADADRHMDADIFAGIGPVLDWLGHELRIGYEMFLAISGDRPKPPARRSCSRRRMCRQRR